MATSLAMMTARRAAAFNRIPTSGSAAQAASFVPRRGLAGAAGTRLSQSQFHFDLILGYAFIISCVFGYCTDHEIVSIHFDISNSFG